MVMQPLYIQGSAANEGIKTLKHIAKVVNPKYPLVKAVSWLVGDVKAITRKTGRGGILVQTTTEKKSLVENGGYSQCKPEKRKRQNAMMGTPEKGGLPDAKETIDRVE
jgi:hypothetical protein